MTSQEADARRIYRFAEADWHVPVSAGADPDAAEAAGRLGAGRKLLAQGDHGFYTQVVRIPPNFEAPRHSHDHEEIFMVLEGACAFDGEPMSAWDMTVVGANQSYGFVAGPEGLQFLIIRRGQASFSGSPA